MPRSSRQIHVRALCVTFVFRMRHSPCQYRTPAAFQDTLALELLLLVENYFLPGRLRLSGVREESGEGNAPDTGQTQQEMNNHNPLSKLVNPPPWTKWPHQQLTESEEDHPLGQFSVHYLMRKISNKKEKPHQISCHNIDPCRERLCAWGMTKAGVLLARRSDITFQFQCVFSSSNGNALGTEGGCFFTRRLNLYAPSLMCPINLFKGPWQTLKICPFAEGRKSHSSHSDRRMFSSSFWSSSETRTKENSQFGGVPKDFSSYTDIFIEVHFTTCVVRDT